MTEHQTAAPVGGAYSCPTCGTTNPDLWRSCSHPGCPDGRDFTRSSADTSGAAVPAFGLGECIRIAQRGFQTWAAKDHNRRWFRKIDGTPIPNDVAVNIAEAFADALAAAPPPPAPVHQIKGDINVEDSQSDHRLHVQQHEEVKAALPPPAPVALVESLKDAVAHLAGATSAYEKFVGRVGRQGQRDPLFRTRYADFVAATERGRSTLDAALSARGAAPDGEG